MLLASTAAAISLGFANEVTESFPELVAGQLALWTGFFLVPYVVARWKGSGSLRQDFGLAMERGDVLRGLLVGAAAQVLALPLVYVLVQAATGDLDLDKPARALLDRADGGGLAAICLGVALIAPVVEEVFFRGLLLRAIEKRWGSTIAILGSACFFAGTHFQLAQFPGLLIAGLLFAWLAVRHGRLGPSIWAHIGFNTVTVIALVR